MNDVLVELEEQKQIAECGNILYMHGGNNLLCTLKEGHHGMCKNGLTSWRAVRRVTSTGGYQ